MLGDEVEDFFLFSFILRDWTGLADTDTLVLGLDPLSFLGEQDIVILVRVVDVDNFAFLVPANGNDTWGKRLRYAGRWWRLYSAVMLPYT